MCKGLVSASGVFSELSSVYLRVLFIGFCFVVGGRYVFYVGLMLGLWFVFMYGWVIVVGSFEYVWFEVLRGFVLQRGLKGVIFHNF